MEYCCSVSHLGPLDLYSARMHDQCENCSWQQQGFSLSNDLMFVKFCIWVLKFETLEQVENIRGNHYCSSCATIKQVTNGPHWLYWWFWWHFSSLYYRHFSEIQPNYFNRLDLEIVNWNKETWFQHSKGNGEQAEDPARSWTQECQK